MDSVDELGFDKIEIGAYTYDVKIDAEAILQTQTFYGVAINGECRFDHLLIILNPIPAISKRRVDLAHECIHAIINKSRLQGYFKDEETEGFVKVFAADLVELLRRNPKLVTYLTEKES